MRKWGDDGGLLCCRIAESFRGLADSDFVHDNMNPSRDTRGRGGLRIHKPSNVTLGVTLNLQPITGNLDSRATGVHGTIGRGNAERF